MAKILCVILGHKWILKLEPVEGSPYANITPYCERCGLIDATYRKYPEGYEYD